MFISFEGPEGAGKTTQVRLAGAALGAKYHHVFVTREPGWGVVGNALRNLLLHPPEDTAIGPMTELMLLMADRANHVEQMIKPNLLIPQAIILCDRYIDSTMAYQGYGRGLDVDTVREMNRHVTGGLVPDLTIYLDIDVEKGLARSQDFNRMEQSGVEFHRRVRAGFLKELTGRTDRRVAHVVADNTLEIVHACVMDAIERVLMGRPLEHGEYDEE
jgi:dTMP kinase